MLDGRGSICICIIAVLFILTPVVHSAEYTWFGSSLGGDGVSWDDNSNWTTDFTNPAGSLPGNSDIARIQAIGWLSEYPTIEDGVSAVCSGLFMGLDNTTHLPGATLTISNRASLTIYPSPAHSNWNPGIQLGWYSDCILNTSGKIDTQDGWIHMGNGDASNGYGNAILNITSGEVRTPTVAFNGVSVCHIQLDGGVLYAGAITGLVATDQSMDITKGQLVLDGDVRSSVDSWTAAGNLTAYNGTGKIERSYNTFYPNKTMVTAIDTLGTCDSPIWWDSLLRIVEDSDILMARAHNANVIFNHSANDPGWGVYGQKLTEFPWRKAQADAEGMKSLSYYETFGQSVSFIAELHSPSQNPDYNTVSHTFWSWQAYSGGDIIWVGVHNWFDDEEFARPWTRTHPIYGGAAMTYPDGTIATGYDGDPTDPRNSRVYDASCGKDILGNPYFDYSYNDNASSSANGQLYIASEGLYSGHISHSKDTACPAWIDYAYASALYATESGFDGMWTDNYSPWDNFSNEPIKHAFGDWSVARFRDYLSENFSSAELTAMGVTNVSTFDIRDELIDIAKGWGWSWPYTNMNHWVWDDTRWQNKDIWNAYIIFQRQIGTEALTDYHNVVHKAARENGIDDFLIQGNDIPIFNLGWTRGNLDMVSTEISAGWNLCSGPRGFTLPPVGRFSPAYKLARQHADSRFVNVWFYNDGYEDYLKHEPPTYYINTNLCWVLYSEMLATNTLPMIHPDNHKNTGSIGLNSMFFDFVSQVDPIFAKRQAVADIGIYYSSSSLLNQILPGGIISHSNQPHQFAVWGWSTALGHLHYQYKPIPEWKFDSETLNDLRVLIIPESEVFDNSDVTNILLPWVQAGGRLIVTGVSGNRQGESGNFETNANYSLSPLTGVNNIASAPSTDLRTVGLGKVYYIKNNIGLDYFNASTASARGSQLSKFSTPMTAVLSGTDPLVLTSTDSDVDENIGLTVYEDICNGKLFIDIVNYNLVLETDQITNTPLLTFDIEIPSWLAGKNITTEIVSPDTVGSALMDLVAIPGRIQLSTPPIKYYASVIIKFQLDANTDDSDSLVNLKDYAKLAEHWMNPLCYAPNNWCDETDIDLSNNVDIEDLQQIALNWL